MRAAHWVGVLGTVLFMVLTGCVKAPERIDVRVGSDRPAAVDSSRVPQTATHEECRAELARAYDNLQHLERENAELRRKADEYKRQRDECRRQLKKYEKD